MYESAVPALSSRKRNHFETLFEPPRILNNRDLLEGEQPTVFSPHEHVDDGTTETTTSRKQPRFRPTLKLRHAGVLNTLLHACLRNGDFLRASRAFGVMIRLEVSARHLDLRHNGLWGIGAELLLRMNGFEAFDMIQQLHSATGRPLESTGQKEDIEELCLPGFAIARGYYERLILQHPHRAFRTGDVSSMEYFHAMFSLWIHQVHNFKTKRDYNNDRALLDPQSVSRKESSGIHLSRSYDAASGVRVSQRNSFGERGDATDFELSQAYEILQKLTDLVKSPPFDRCIRLLGLLGMVNIWIHDKCVRRASDSDEAAHHYQVAKQVFEQIRDLGGSGHNIDIGQ